MPSAENDAAEWASMLDREPCDMCGHEQHGDTDCGESTGYDHLNGFHECGCPGSLAEQLAQVWDSAHEDFCVVAGQMRCTLHGNPHRVIPPAVGHE